jgi:hypothetical protein
VVLKRDDLWLSYFFLQHSCVWEKLFLLDAANNRYTYLYIFPLTSPLDITLSVTIIRKKSERDDQPRWDDSPSLQDWFGAQKKTHTPKKCDAGASRGDDSIRIIKQGERSKIYFLLRTKTQTRPLPSQSPHAQLPSVTAYKIIIPFFRNLICWFFTQKSVWSDYIITSVWSNLIGWSQASSPILYSSISPLLPFHRFFLLYLSSPSSSSVSAAASAQF